MPENEKLKPVRKKKGIDFLTKRIVNLVFINLFLIFSGILWLDYIGIINIREDVYPKLAKVPVLNNLVPKRSEDPYLLSREEHRKEEIAKQIEWEKIKKYEESLKEKEIALKGREKSLEEYENRLKLKKKKLMKNIRRKKHIRKRLHSRLNILSQCVLKKLLKDWNYLMIYF